MAEQELGYYETLALLPAYAAGELDRAAQAAVDDYLQRQITLFRRLDALEEAAGQAKLTDVAVAATSATAQSPEVTQSAQDNPLFVRVMEGQAAPEPDNPLLMRTAPQAYIDEQTGQRYIVPRRAGNSTPQPYNAAQPSGSQGVWRTIWGLLALATIIGVVLITLYHRNLQQTVSATQAQLLDVQRQMSLISTANRALSLRASDRPIQGTLLIRDRQGLLTISGLDTLRSDQRYQLWIHTNNGDQVAATQFATTENQPTRWLMLDLPLDGNFVIGAAINVEAVGNITTPSSPMLIESVP